MNNQFSQKVSDIIIYSKEEAYRLNNRYIKPEHLLLGLIRDGEGKAIDILKKLNVDLSNIKKELESSSDHDDTMNDFDHFQDISLSKECSKILKMCILEARLCRTKVADTEHILLAILKDKENLAASV